MFSADALKSLPKMFSICDNLPLEYFSVCEYHTEHEQEDAVTSATGQEIDTQEIGLRITELYRAIQMMPNAAHREQLRLLLLHIDLIIWS